jgi:hypothetical protein
MVAPDQSARADYFKYHSMWLKKVKPAHSFLVGSKLDRKEISSINRAASGMVDINAQGIHSIAQHAPGKFINYDRVEPGDRERCAVICNQFVNEGVENIGILLPIADPETLTVQYLHAVTQLTEVTYWQTFNDGFAYTGEVENHPDYQRIVTTFADRITSSPVAIKLVCHLVVMADIDSTLTFMAMGYPIAKCVGPVLFVEFFGILKHDTNFKTFSVDVLDSLRNRNFSFYNSGIVALNIVLPRLTNAAFQHGTSIIFDQFQVVPALTDATVQPFITAISDTTQNLYAGYRQLIQWRNTGHFFSHIWGFLSNRFSNGNATNGNENAEE